MSFTDVVLQHAPWSYSKTGVLEKCVRQYHKKHVQRKREQGESSVSKVGVAVHYVTERVTKEDCAPTQEMLDDAMTRGRLTLEEHDAMKSFMPKVELFANWLRNFIHKYGARETLVEHKMAVNRFFNPVSFMPTRPWREGDPAPRAPGADTPLNGQELAQAVLEGTAPVMRGVLDLGVITNENDLVIIDHKTGKHRKIEDHSHQLQVYRLFGVTHYPVRSVQCAIHYVETGKIDWTPPVSAADVRRKAQPWLVEFLNKQSRRLQVVNNAAPEPEAETGWQCEYCGFVGECPEGEIEVANRRQKRKDKEQSNKGGGGIVSI